MRWLRNCSAVRRLVTCQLPLYLNEIAELIPINTNGQSASPPRLSAEQVSGGFAYFPSQRSSRTSAAGLDYRGRFDQSAGSAAVRLAISRGGRGGTGVLCKTAQSYAGGD